MEYLGYPYLEARPESWLEDRGELRLAYKAHATTRPNTSMLYCGGALLDAMRVGQPLKGLGLVAELPSNFARGLSGRADSGSRYWVLRVG